MAKAEIGSTNDEKLTCSRIGDDNCGDGALGDGGRCVGAAAATARNRHTATKHAGRQKRSGEGAT